MMWSQCVHSQIFCTHLLTLKQQEKKSSDQCFVSNDKMGHCQWKICCWFALACFQISPVFLVCLSNAHKTMLNIWCFCSQVRGHHSQLELSFLLMKLVFPSHVNSDLIGLNPHQLLQVQLSLLSQFAAKPLKMLFKFVTFLKSSANGLVWFVICRAGSSNARKTPLADDCCYSCINSLLRIALILFTLLDHTPNLPLTLHMLPLLIFCYYGVCSVCHV